jgi:hypothetical protein
MFKRFIKYSIPVFILLITSNSLADDTLFSTHLFEKFQAKSCTICHDFHEKVKDGLFYSTHKKRQDINKCVNCHSKKVTGFEHPEEWFAQPGLYTSGMDAKETCEKTKEAFHAKFKSDALLARQMEKHLLHDPRILWGIEGATPNSGNLPLKKKEKDLVKGGLEEWKTQVMAWINGGMKCE